MKIPHAEVSEYARDSIQEVLLDGDRRGKSGWEHMPVHEHLLHAREHIIKYACGDTSEDHLANAQTRIAMARSILRREGQHECPKRDNHQ